MYSIKAETALRHETQKANARFTSHVRVTEEKIREMTKRYDAMESRLQASNNRDHGEGDYNDGLRLHVLTFDELLYFRYRKHCGKLRNLPRLRKINWKLRTVI